MAKKVKVSKDKVSEYKKDLAKFSRLSYDRGLVAARGGNLSIRIPGTERVLITPSGISLRDITPGLILEVAREVNLVKVALVEFALMGTKELCDYVSEAAKQNMEVKALLLKGHGIIGMGPDIASAYYIADLVEDNAKVALLASM